MANKKNELKLGQSMLERMMNSVQGKIFSRFRVNVLRIELTRSEVRQYLTSSIELLLNLVNLR